MSAWKTLDANEAVARIAYQLSEVIAIYPITPSSPMGEWADTWAAAQQPNLWGTLPEIIEMQSEGGAAGAIHGALQTGCLSTTFTASQGLLLMIPNMYKIAGELTPCVLHVAARSLAAQALSIFGDHSDVMAVRATGFALLAAATVQETQDMALIAHASTLTSRIPFLHFFDGFRTSHEIAKIDELDLTTIGALIDTAAITAHRQRALSPEHPVLRGTAQNPDVYFQAREAANPFYIKAPEMVQQQMNHLAQLTGRQYHLFDYHGHPAAERVLVAMGSSVDTIQATVDALVEQGEKVGLIKVRLYRPFAREAFLAALPTTAKTLAVLDRTKEPGSTGDPLYLDCSLTLQEAWQNGDWAQLPRIIGGRYGLSSKEFTPAMVKGIFDHLNEKTLKNRFTIGIDDDVTHSSLSYEPDYTIEHADTFRCLFYGLGSDGTVSANKNSIKIIGENTDHYAQGYFVYDSKKAGAITISHLRFGPQPIHAPYLITQAHFIACHNPIFLERFDVLETLLPGGVFLLNAPDSEATIWDRLPRMIQHHLIEKKARFYLIDASRVARELGMPGRINTVMQTCFFAISGVLPHDEALDAIRDSIKKTYGKKGDEVVRLNLAAMEGTLAALQPITVPETLTSIHEPGFHLAAQAPDFVRKVLAPIIAGQGDRLPVSAFPVDGTFPTATAQWEKRNLAEEIPVWDPAVCIQCGKCAMVCPHAVIRVKVYEPALLAQAPATFKSCATKDREWDGLNYSIQVSPEDCTGCGICVDVCPARNKSQTRLKALNMTPQPPLRETESANWDFFLQLPELERTLIKTAQIRQQQVQQPLFEFSGACAGCGETPYLKLVSQLFGDRMVVANATGCSSIYGGNLPTTPWSVNNAGRGPAWANSLFEDNAEFGLGMRVSLDKQAAMARELLLQLRESVGIDLAQALLEATQTDEADIFTQRERVVQLKAKLQVLTNPSAKRLLDLADHLVKHSVWIIGGDGWAYDIGFGGLDHVLASSRNVNVLVLDTEVYSNTGGQMSKATPRAAVAKFAAGGKPTGKKDLGLIAMSYGHVYVGRVAFGAKDEHTLRVFLEAEAWPGPSLIIAYSHCVAHGIQMNTALQEHKAAVDSGHWLLYRYHPGRAAKGENPFQLDSKAPRMALQDYLYRQNRFKMLTKSHPKEAQVLLQQAQEEINHKWEFYQNMAAHYEGQEGK